MDSENLKYLSKYIPITKELEEEINKIEFVKCFDNGTIILEEGNISYKIFVEKAREYIKADNTILDFVCGTGLFYNGIAENAGIVHAIDISTKMICSRDIFHLIKY